MTNLENLRDDPRLTVRRGGQPDGSGNSVVRAVDNTALDVALRLGNELGKPVVVFSAPVSLLALRSFGTAYRGHSMAAISMATPALLVRFSVNTTVHGSSGRYSSKCVRCRLPAPAESSTPRATSLMWNRCERCHV
jgi:hypothetical protein